MSVNVTPKMGMNFELLILNQNIISGLGRVSDLRIFENNSNVFHSEGLFSSSTFGDPTDNRRSENFGYIDLGMKVFHPLVWEILTTLKRLYGEIINGDTYAIFDEKLKDFVKSNSKDGDTGFNFFYKHMDKLKLEDNDSEQRSFKLQILEKYDIRDIVLDKFLVLPAGLRDYIVDKNGKPSEDDVNELYRKILTSINILNNMNIKGNEDILIPIRKRVQAVVYEIYQYFFDILDGKGGYIEGKAFKRAIAGSTANVLTSMPITVYDLGDNKPRFKYNDTVMGLYQYCGAISPVTKYLVNHMYLSKVFSENSMDARLIDPKTFKTVDTAIDHETRDTWLSEAGLDKIIAKMKYKAVKSAPVTIDGKWLALVYDDGKSIEIVTDSNLLSRDDYNKKNFRGITYAELFYTSIYSRKDRYPGYITRYPVSSLGSVYATKFYVKTTIKGRSVDISINGEKSMMHEYPIFKSPYYNSLTPHDSRLARMGADHDGDKSYVTILLSNNSVREVNKYLESREAYVTPSGAMTFSIMTDTLETTMKSLTRRRDLKDKRRYTRK